MTDQSKARRATVFDSTRLQVGESYARALLGVGQAEGSLVTLMKELASFSEAVSQIPGLANVLESPRVAVADKEKLVDKALGNRASKTFVNFVKLLVRRGRFDCLNAIDQSAVRLQDEITGVIRGVVTSATEINQQTITRLAENLGKKLGREVVLESEIDPSIIGGVVVRVGDTVYDSSVKNRLQQLKRRAVKNATDAIRGQMQKFTSSGA